MAKILIKSLPEKVVPEDNDVLIIEDTLTKKITFKNLINNFLSKKQDVLDVNPQTTVGELSSLGINGVNYKLQGMTYIAGDGISIIGNTISLYKNIKIESFTYNQRSGTFTYEIGTNLPTPQFDWILNTLPVKITINGTSITPVSSGSYIYPNDINSDTTIRLNITGQRGEQVSSSINFVFANYVYYDILSSTSVPLSPGSTNRTVDDFSKNGANFSYQKDKYLYIYTTKPSGSIQTYVLGTWVNVNTVAMGLHNITLKTGITFSYYVYRTDKFNYNGSATYRFA